MIDFKKKTWYDASDVVNRIPISPSNLNRIEDGLGESINVINLMESDLYNHWWRKSKVVGGRIDGFDIKSAISFYLWNSTAQSSTIYYADSVNIKIDNNTKELYAELENYSSMTLSYSSISSNGSYALQNKYFMLDAPSGKTLYYTTDRYVRLSDSSTENKYGFRVYETSELKLVNIYGDAEYVNSADINTYPNGWSDADSTLYEYLGLPFVNSRTACSMFTGWYWGDGESERIINTEKRPKCVLVYKNTGNESYVIDYAPYCYGIATETFTFGGVELFENGFIVKTGSPNANAKLSKYGYIVFYY